MADPISLSSSILALLTVATKVSLQFSDFASSLHSAPQQIRDLSKALTDLCSILRRLQQIFSRSGDAALGSRGLVNDFRNVLNSCMEKLVQLQKLVTEHSAKRRDGIWSRSLKKWGWVLREKEVEGLVTQLEVHKATLGITLLMATHNQTASVKSTADRIEMAVGEIRGMMMRDEDNGKAAGTYNLILDRYLSSASSVLSSRPGSPVSDFGLDMSIVVHRDTRHSDVPYKSHPHPQPPTTRYRRHSDLPSRNPRGPRTGHQAHHATAGSIHRVGTNARHPKTPHLAPPPTPRTPPPASPTHPLPPPPPPRPQMQSSELFLLLAGTPPEPRSETPPPLPPRPQTTSSNPFRRPQLTLPLISLLDLQEENPPSSNPFRRPQPPQTNPYHEFRPQLPPRPSLNPFGEFRPARATLNPFGEFRALP